MRVVIVAAGAFFALALLILVSNVLGLIPDSVQLAWMPYRVHQESRIVTNSQGYIAAQTQQLRMLQVQYLSPDTVPAQKAAIVNQMHGVADRLHGDDLPDDIRTFLATH